MIILSNMTLIDVVINIFILIVVIQAAIHFFITASGKFAGTIAKEQPIEKNLQKVKYLSWVDRFRDNYEKQNRYIQGFQLNLIKCGVYLLVVLICRSTIDFDLSETDPAEIVFFIFGFILMFIMLLNIIKIMPACLRMSKEIRDFMERNKISDSGLEIYDQKYFGVTMQDVIGLRKNNLNDEQAD
ncbi:MAG: hypothetical protein P8X42_09220 [Calditrichaceae bacterium]